MSKRRSFGRRDFLYLATAGAASVTLAACGSAGPPGEGVKTTATEESPGQAEPSVAPAEAVTIQYWVGWGGQTAETLGQCGERFTEKNPSIKINVIGASSNEKVLAAIAAGTPPQMGTNLDYLALIARGVCEPQTEWINSSSVVDKAEFAGEAWGLFTWQGEVYGIPGVESALREALGYNLDLVEEAGLDAENPPQTWHEVFEWHKALTKFDNAGNAVVVGLDPMDDMGGSIGAGDPWMWPPSWGFDYFDEENGEFDIDRPETAEIFSTIKMFYDYVGVEKMAAFRKGYGTWTASPTAGFPAGAQAMIITGGWSPGWLTQSAPDKRFAYSWMPVSAPRKGKKLQVWGGHAPLIFKDAKHREQAFRFAEYLTCDDEAASILWEGVGFQPARRSWWAQVDAGRYQGFDFFVKAVTEADEVWPDQPNPIVSVTGDEWVKAYEGVIYGDLAPQQAATNMQIALTKALAEMLD